MRDRGQQAEDQRVVARELHVTMLPDRSEQHGLRLSTSRFVPSQVIQRADQTVLRAIHEDTPKVDTAAGTAYGRNVDAEELRAVQSSRIQRASAIAARNST